jgi:hypothetical protein
MGDFFAGMHASKRLSTVRRNPPWSAKVGAGVVTRTDLLGTYKVPGFGKEVIE